MIYRGRLLALLLVLPAMACGVESKEDTKENIERQKLATESTMPTLNTAIDKYLQVDQLGAFPSPEDANLFLGTDPADGSLSRNFPPGPAAAVYTDWNDIGAANHLLVDLDGAKGKDESSFPSSNECVGASTVLSKMDLTYVAAANNMQYVYLAVQRSTNNGDAAYYWLFTKLEPRMALGEAPCKADQRRLMYDISKGDVLIGGHFQPGKETLLRVFVAGGTGFVDEATILHPTAVGAIDYTDATIWVEDSSRVAGVAVNTTKTSPGVFGAAGVGSMVGPDLAPQIFAEAAVPLATFTHGSSCGAKYYGSVITRSSGSGATSPDLKDLAGPAVFNFSSIEAKVTTTPACNSLMLSAKAVSGGVDLAADKYTCLWNLTLGQTQSQFNTCDVMLTAPGTYTGSVTVTETATGCAESQASLGGTVEQPLVATALLEADCNKTIKYTGGVTGGSASGPKAWAWDLKAGGATVRTSAEQSGSFTDLPPGALYIGNLTVTESRTVGSSSFTCTAAASGSATPYAPLVLALTPLPQNNICAVAAEGNLTINDTVSLTANVSGGSGSHSYAWTGLFSGCTEATCLEQLPSTMCYDNSTHVTVTDAAAMCGSAVSSDATVQKRTTITVTVP